MKNLIIAVSMLFAVGANAQAKKAVPARTATKAPVVKEVVQAKLSADEAAAKDLKALTTFISIPEEKESQLLSLFRKKHQIMDSEELTPERKAIATKMIAQKFETAFDKETFEKIKANTVLYSKLIN